MLEKVPGNYSVLRCENSFVNVTLRLLISHSYFTHILLILHNGCLDYSLSIIIIHSGVFSISSTSLRRGQNE